jgi:hypothetical protein
MFGYTVEAGEIFKQGDEGGSLETFGHVSAGSKTLAEQDE